MARVKKVVGAARAKKAVEAFVAEKVTEMKNKKVKATATTETRLCTCGCKEVLNGKANFRPGHDQRLKGVLIRISGKNPKKETVPALAIERFSLIAFMQQEPYRAVMQAAIAAGKTTTADAPAKVSRKRAA